MQRKIRAVFMRGGSSKALFFHRNHLPVDPVSRDKIILSAFGSPDPFKRHVDGMGGATSSTSKVAIINPSNEPNHDIDYLFGQVSIDRPLINYNGNCGNISSAVGPFAIEEGLVEAREPITEVKIYQVNTKKTIISQVPVKNGYPLVSGNYAIHGVPGNYAKIKLHFIDPGGAVTGKLLPTGKLKDVIQLPNEKKYNVTIFDAANPIVFVNARELGLVGTEIYEIDNDDEIRNTLEEIRVRASIMAGIANNVDEAHNKSPLVPFIAFISEPSEFKSVTGDFVRAEDCDLVVRIISMGALHKAYPITGGICTSGAAKVKGTIVNEVCSLKDNITKEEINLGHPSGVLSIAPEIEKVNGSFHYIKATCGRTARRLMEGHVFV